MRERKPKYYLRASFNYSGWWCICQVSNNVVVCECSEEEIAGLLLDYLNSLPRGLMARVKAK